MTRCEKSGDRTARRVLVRHMIERDLSEHRALTVINMSASSWRYEPAPDRNVALRAKILALHTATAGTGQG